jgi:hypothetical protein
VTPLFGSGMGVDEVVISQSLTGDKVCQLKCLLSGYSDILSNTQGNQIITLQTGVPVHKIPYPVSHAQREKK